MQILIIACSINITAFVAARSLEIGGVCSFETSNHLGVLLVVVSPFMNESNMLSISHIIFVFTNIRVCPLALHRGADKSLARPTSRCILFDGENISFDASLVLYI